LVRTEQLNSLLQKISTNGKALSKEFLESFSLAFKDKFSHCFDLSHELARFVSYTDTFKLDKQPDRNLVRKIIRYIQSKLFRENTEVMRIDFNKKTQIRMELNRLQYAYRYYYDKQLFEKYEKKREIEKEFSEIFDKIQALVFNCKRYDETCQSKTKTLF
jgi:hypothetical protein